MKFKALQTVNISVCNRHIEAKAGEFYELTREEHTRIPAGIFAPYEDSILEETIPPLKGALDILASDSEEPRFVKRRGKR